MDPAGRGEEGKWASGGAGGGHEPRSEAALGGPCY